MMKVERLVFESIWVSVQITVVSSVVDYTNNG